MVLFEAEPTDCFSCRKFLTRRSIDQCFISRRRQEFQPYFPTFPREIAGSNGRGRVSGLVPTYTERLRVRHTPLSADAFAHNDRGGHETAEDEELWHISSSRIFRSRGYGSARVAPVAPGLPFGRFPRASYGRYRPCDTCLGSRGISRRSRRFAGCGGGGGSDRPGKSEDRGRKPGYAYTSFSSARSYLLREEYSDGTRG